MASRARAITYRVEWVARFYGSRNHEVTEALRKFFANFWIEPIDDGPVPAKPFCLKRHGAKLLEARPMGSNHLNLFSYTKTNKHPMRIKKPLDHFLKLLDRWLNLCSFAPIEKLTFS